MNIIDFLKKQKRWTVSKYNLWKAYQSDYEEYKRWQYHNPDVKTQNALEAKILRQTHIIEKGMSLSRPREKFGVQKALELMGFIDEFAECGYKIEDSIPVLNAFGVLKAYLTYHEEHGFRPENVLKKYEKYSKYFLQKEKYGIVEVSKSELNKGIQGSFPEFFMSRHSVRQFSERIIDISDIEKAVKLAMKAPSACNRQSCKVYFYKDKYVNKELGELIAGNTGFDDEVQNYIVVTSDMSAFYDPFERNQVYVDGGIFTMALVEALHYYGIASCILQNGEYKERNLKFKEICKNIPENEKIVLFIAIGYYKDTFTYAVSQKELGECVDYSINMEK